MTLGISSKKEDCDECITFINSIVHSVSSLSSNENPLNARDGSKQQISQKTRLRSRIVKILRDRITGKKMAKKLVAPKKEHDAAKLDGVGTPTSRSSTKGARTTNQKNVRSKTKTKTSTVTEPPDITMLVHTLSDVVDDAMLHMTGKDFDGVIDRIGDAVDDAMIPVIGKNLEEVVNPIDDLIENVMFVCEPTTCIGCAAKRAT